jgi:hypothetical protein
VSINSPNQRKLYSTQRVAPSIITNESGQVLDANRFQVHRDYFLITRKLGVPLDVNLYPIGLFEDVVVNFNNQSEKTVTLYNTYPFVPIIVLELTDPFSNQFVTCYVKDASTTQVTIGTSANFTGTIRYYAIYSAVYPCQVQDVPSSPGTTYVCCAGSALIGNTSNYSVSFSTLPVTAIKSLYSTYDSQGSGTANVFFSTANIYPTMLSGEVSAPLNNSINFLTLG